MKLLDLQPIVLGLRKRPGLGVAFNCPGACCAAQRELQERAAQLEAAGDAGARAARHEAFLNQPFRFWAAFADRARKGETDGRGAVIDELYTRSGETHADLTIVEAIDRTAAGHVRVRIKNGKIDVV